MKYDNAPVLLAIQSTQRRQDTLLALATGFVALVTAATIILWAGGFGWVLIPGAALPYLVIACVVLSRIDRFHPHDRFGLANAVTLTRAVINCLLIGLLIEYHTLFTYWGDWADWLFLAAALVSLSLDGVDGLLARRQNLTSRFGARFDMEIDALLLTLLAVAAVALDKVGPWVILIGTTYYLFMGARALLPRLRRDLPESMRRKAVCVLQAGILIALVTPFIDGLTATILAATALAALAYSFTVDIVWLAARRR
ncbi:MAG: CDP-alcohol phosphatidyltransferase family protein [Salinarimonas sp.]|nr:CDP-alcohol phosphatidyltransferase family protein [Salinarimonas sp.]